MKSILLGLGLILCVSFLDVGQAWTMAQASDIQQAQAAMMKQEFQKAVDLLSPKVEKLSREGLFILAKSYSGLKQHEAAIKTYTACLALNSKDFEAKSLIGSEQMLSGKDKEALSNLKEALEINPKFPLAYKILIQYYEKKKNKYELRLLYEDMMENLGESVEAVTKLCELTTLDRLYDLAFKHCQRGIKISPTTPENYVYYGISAHETGQPEKADQLLKKAADDFPKSELAQINYAQHLDEKKNFIGSYSFYKKAVQANPESVPGLVGVGTSGLEIQKYAESLEAYSKACKLDRKTLPAFRKAANTLRTMKIQDWLKKFETGVESCGS